MWNIAGISMIVSKWSPVAAEESPEIKTILMWITLKQVPHQMYSREGLEFITSEVGKTIRLHPDTELCSNFEESKIFVEVDMSNTLPKVHRFKSKFGIDAHVEFCYPWLPARCSECSKWGHLQKDCKEKSMNPTKEKQAETDEAAMETKTEQNTQKPEVKETETEGIEVTGVEKPNSETEEKQQELITNWSTISQGKAGRSNEKRLKKSLSPPLDSQF